MAGYYYGMPDFNFKVPEFLTEETSEKHGLI